MRVLINGGLGRDEVLRTTHGLDQKSFNTLADISIFDLEETVLKSATAGSVHIDTNVGHTLAQGYQAARVRGCLLAQQSLLGQAGKDLLSNKRVGLVAQFFDQLVSGRRIKDVVLNRHIFIIKLVDQAKGLVVGGTVAKSGLTELLRDAVEHFDLASAFIVEPRVSLSVNDAVDLIVRDLSSTLNDSLANPGILIKDTTSVRVDLEDNTDSVCSLPRSAPRSAL